MKHLVKSFCAVLALGGTGVLLLADSAEKCTHGVQSVSFTISSGCGPAGTLTLTSAGDSCALEAPGADFLQLPTQGRFGSDAQGHVHYDLVQGSWELSGTRAYDSADLPDGGWPSDAGRATVLAARECLNAQEDGQIKLRCTDRAQLASDQEPRVLTTCEATLTPQ